MTKRQKKDPKRTEAIKFAFWNKWAGTKPVEVLRSKGIDYENPWYVRDITSPEFDKGITKVVK
jgi:hypothetical protein